MKTIGQLFSESWEGLKGNWLSPILATLIYLIINGGVTGGLNTFEDGLSLLGVFVILPLTVGISQTFLYYIRGMRQQCTETMFQRAFREYSRSLSLGFMVYIYTFLWTLLLIVPGIIKSLSYSMTYYVAADHPDWSVGECINESMRLMQGNKMRLFLIWLAFVGLSILSVITLGIAMLWLCPWMYSIQANFYEDLKLQQR